jgi:Cd2+/Zn2+-exporting ATPase
VFVHGAWPVALLGPWLLGWTWMQAIYKALVLLVIACPCALVISTPGDRGQRVWQPRPRRGILIKGGVYLEEARKLKAIALDKTGTHHRGQAARWWLVMWSTAAVRGHRSRPWRSCWPRSPTTRCPRPLPPGPRSPEQLAGRASRRWPGRGVKRDIGGERMTLGNHRLIEERGQCAAPHSRPACAPHEEGRPHRDAAGQPRPQSSRSSPWPTRIKPSSREAVQREQRAWASPPVDADGRQPGHGQADRRSEAGIDEVRGNLLPEDKLEAIQATAARHGATAMTGDGINDAPALAQADIGVAMGAAGTDTAMEAADVVVMNDDLRRIAETMRLSRAHACGAVAEVIALALGIKAVFLVLALFGNATMWMAVFADMGASLLLQCNGPAARRRGRRYDTGVGPGRCFEGRPRMLFPPVARF